MVKIHAWADVKSSKIGKNTRVWQFCVIFPDAKIGENCNICANVLVENEVVIGNNCTIKSGVQIWDGITLEDDVFIGPNVTFTNDLYPRSGNHNYQMRRTLVKKGASIGANSTIVAGHIIGENSLIGAGSVVTKDIPAHTIWYGNPATMRGYIKDDKMQLIDNEINKMGGVNNSISCVVYPLEWHSLIA